MSHAVDERVRGMLAEAMERGGCCVPHGEDAERVRRALARRVANGTVVSPARGLFVDVEVWGRASKPQRALIVARGLQEQHPDWVFCGPTAALAYGVDVSETLLRRAHVALPSGRCGSSTAGVCRYPVLLGPKGDASVEMAGGLRVTPPDQTVFDCLRWADFAHGLGVVDSALRIGLVGREDLVALAERLGRRHRGVERVFSALEWADPRSENGGESIARGRMLLLGYARPELQVEVPRVVERGEPYRADFCWVRADGLVILGELDGKVKYVDEAAMGGRTLEEVLSDENVRGSRFTLYDVSLMRFRFGVTEHPREFAALLDEYGVPKRGSALALPEGAPMVPDWAALRRNVR